MAHALITPEVLRWARDRAGISVDALAKKIGTNPEKIAEWESGISQPTFKQAEKIAQATHVPFGYLFLPEPPEEELAIPDLRTTAGSPRPHLDADFKDALRDIQFKLDWYRDYRKDQGHSPLEFVGRFRLTAKPTEVAEDIRATLRVTSVDRNNARNWEEYFRLLVSRAEEAGICVMRNGVVGNNSHRPLNVEVFRGFAISDPIVPTIFVNGRDAKAAQIFTLAHELAHIWLGQSGISDPFGSVIGDDKRHGGIEKFCNAVATEFLTPQEEFISYWNKSFDIGRNINDTSTYFCVSRIVIAIRARDLGIIGQDDFEKLYDAERQEWKKKKENSKSGGNYYMTAKIRNGENFLNAVLSSAMSGNLLLRNAGALLNMAPKSLYEAYRKHRAGQL